MPITTDCIRLPALLLSLALPIGASAGDCSPESLTRPTVDHLFTSKQYEAAIDRLQKTVHAQDRCPNQALDNAWYWLRSDLSLTYLKAGREQECLSLLAPLVNNPRSPLDIQHNLENDVRVARALETNQRLCRNAHEVRLNHYLAAPCPTAPAAARDSVAVAPDRCLALMPAAEQGSCPRLELWENGQNRGALQVIDAGQRSPLADTSRCCSIQSLRLSRLAGNDSLRLLGEGRDCFGGTAYDRIDTLYSWQGRQLKPLADYSRSD
ncbi:MAG: hypothetical protein ACN6O6_22280 [Pseudomonas sp.]|uniref:hypothetical protein n=1 Tax=Pseudomonas sp. TaxID=306 RepID=UPI003D0F83D8